jgi:hypothetical protein
LETTARKIAGWFGGLGKAKKEAEMREKKLEALGLINAAITAHSRAAWIQAKKTSRPSNVGYNTRWDEAAWLRWWNAKGHKIPTALPDYAGEEKAA